MNPFVEAQFVMIGLFVVFVVIAIMIRKKKTTHDYTVVDNYLLQPGTPLYYRNFRQLTLRAPVTGRNLWTQKAVKLYLTAEGEFVEVFHLLFDQELTTLDKEMQVLRLEDTEGNKKLISYDLALLPEQTGNFLAQVQIGAQFQLKALTEDLIEGDTSQTAILINEHVIL